MTTSEHESPAVSEHEDPRVTEARERVAHIPFVKKDDHTPPEWTPVTLSPREVAARRLLALRALEAVLAVEVKKARAEADALFVRAGQREPAELPDGTPLGNVRADKGTSGGWRVTDAGALRAWVETNVPGGIVEQVTTVVDPDLIESLVGGIYTWPDEGEGNTATVNPATGEVIDVPPGVSYVKAGPPKLVVTGDKGAADAVRQWLAPALAQLEAGA